MGACSRPFGDFIIKKKSTHVWTDLEKAPDSKHYFDCKILSFVIGHRMPIIFSIFSSPKDSSEHLFVYIFDRT